MGGGTQGRFKCGFFHAHTGSLRALCAETVESRAVFAPLRRAKEPRVECRRPGPGSRHSTLGPRLLSGAVLLRPGAAVQEHAGDDALRPLVAGLLAAEPSFTLLSTGFAPAGG